jgi:nickel-dependent lactate racemase
VSGGGSPRDNTLIQAHKALDAACRFASDGAEVVFVAACENGAGSRDMEPFLADPRPEAIIARLRSCYVQYGHTTLRLVEKTARFRVLCRSTLQDDLVRRLGMTPIREVDEVFERWREEGHGTAVAVMPGAPVYPALR